MGKVVLGGRAILSAKHGVLGTLFLYRKAAATHSLTCGGVPRPRKQRSEELTGGPQSLSKQWQKQHQGVPPVNLQASEHEDVVLVSFVPCLLCVSNVNTIQRRTLLYGLATRKVFVEFCEDCGCCQSYPLGWTGPFPISPQLVVQMRV